MKTPRHTFLRFLAVLLGAAFFAAPSFAQKDNPAGSVAQANQPTEAEMMKQMLELAQLNENHKLLGTLAGTWTFTTKMWMSPDPNAAPTQSTGLMVRKPIMEGRYFTAETSGKMLMPGADGKMTEMNFQGMSMEGYDNVKKKFVSTWIDNMGTGILMSEGIYDAGTKAFTFTADGEFMPGMKMTIREVIRIIDNDHHVMEWYETTHGHEARTMEISYTRKK